MPRAFPTHRRKAKAAKRLKAYLKRRKALGRPVPVTREAS